MLSNGYPCNKLPFEQVQNIEPIVHYFFFVEDGQIEFKIAEAKISELSNVDLVHYLKAIGTLVRKRPGCDVETLKPLIELVYRVCVKERVLICLSRFLKICCHIYLDFFRQVL